MWKYIRYSLLSLVALTATVGMFASGVWLWTGFGLAVVLALGGDTLLGDDLAEPRYAHPWLLDLALYSNLPMLVAMTLGFAWQLAPGDALGLGGLIQEVFGVDVLARKPLTTGWHLLGGGLGLGLLYGVSGTNVGHELTHRTWSMPAQVVGRWLLAFTCDASFSIEHVYGHHKHVATRQDPATGRRGESAWRFLVRSGVGSLRGAFEIERERLGKQGRTAWSPHNKVLRGGAMSACLFALVGLVAGLKGVLAFGAVSLYGKSWLEFINYVEHYGIVRVPGAPVEPRHSWNCNRRISGYLLYNLTRHSHHHAMGEKPFWQLRAYPDTPTMPLGYLGMVLVALIPPLWDRVMIPRVLAWDARFASPAEADLIAQANALSGHPWFTHGLPQGMALPSITQTTALDRQKFEQQEAEAAHQAPPKSLAQVIEGLFGGAKTHQIRFVTDGDAAAAAQGRELPVPAGETILQAALSQGMAFPHNCRVGGCASCKCKLVSGQVKSMTDASYILSAQEVQQGYILACQSIPRGPLTLEVPGFHPDELALTYKSGATIFALDRLTHDIVGVTLKLDGPIFYEAGQFAQLHVPGKIGAPRSYSFARAMPAGAEATDLVEFHVRLVPGGTMSTWFHHDARCGDRVHLHGPFGEVTLAPEDAPLLLLAGGSGMAPMHALLEDALRRPGHTSPILYLFGARTERDLYFEAEIRALAAAHPHRPFTLMTVLSQAPAGGPWAGPRGLITEFIPSGNLADHQVYMCGPPAMIDAAESALAGRVPAERIHADAFYDQSFGAPAADQGAA